MHLFFTENRFCLSLTLSATFRLGLGATYSSAVETMDGGTTLMCVMFVDCRFIQNSNVIQSESSKQSTIESQVSTPAGTHTSR